VRRQNLILAKEDKNTAGQNTVGQNTVTQQKPRMADRNLLTIGAIFIIIVVSILLYFPAKVLTAWWMVFATMIALFGIWLVALAAMQRSNPLKYGRSAFSYFGWGLLIIAVGSAWFLYYQPYGWIYSLAVILIVLAAVAIAAAIRRK